MIIEWCLIGIFSLVGVCSVVLNINDFLDLFFKGCFELVKVYNCCIFEY